MNKHTKAPKRLAENAYTSLNKSGRGAILSRWKNMEDLHTKSAAEAEDPDKEEYFTNMAAPYKEAREHLEKLIRGDKDVI